jgi:hypothetical protein
MCTGHSPVMLHTTNEPTGNDKQYSTQNILYFRMSNKLWASRGVPEVKFLSRNTNDRSKLYSQNILNQHKMAIRILKVTHLNPKITVTYIGTGVSCAGICNIRLLQQGQVGWQPCHQFIICCTRTSCFSVAGTVLP